MKDKLLISLFCLIIIICLAGCINTASYGQYFIVQIIPCDGESSDENLTKALNNYLINTVSYCSTVDEIAKTLKTDINDINNVIIKHGNFTTEIKTKNFDEMVFGNKILHSGEYYALIIDGGGDKDNSEYLIYSAQADIGQTPVIKSRIFSKQ